MNKITFDNYLINKKKSTLITICQLFVQDMSHQYVYKIVLCGQSSVGKSSLLQRITDDTFQDSYLATIGVDFKFKTLQIEPEKRVKLQIWDTAGQQKFRTITSAYYKAAQGIALVFDCTVIKTLEQIQTYWLGEVEKYAQKNIRCILLGNKSDILEEQAKIKLQQALNQFQQKHKITWNLVSAKSGANVSDAFINLTKQCIKQFGNKNMEEPSHNKNVLDDIRKKRAEFELKSGNNSQPKTKQCC